jgi:lon-related putative ATP-dependent protease
MRELRTEELKNACICEKFTFLTTDEVQPLINIVGQDRAIRAIETGLNTKADGFNIFITGPTGTGRNTTIKAILEEKAQKEPSPSDWCYVYNFSDSNRPNAISLNPGEGYKFKRDMAKFVTIAKERISKAFESDDYDKEISRITDAVNKKSIALSEEIDKIATKLGFKVNYSPAGVFTIPVIDGKQVKPEEYQNLPEDQKKEIEKNRQILQNEINSAIKRGQQLERDLREKIEGLDKKIVLFAIEGLIEELKQNYAHNEEILVYFDNVKDDIVNNLTYFKDSQKAKKTATSPFDFEAKSTEFFFQRYSVNLIIDNKETKGAPVVFEINPTYYNLFGSLEYMQEFGALTTNLGLIRGGSFLKANGGYIVLQAMDVLTSPYVWETLKRTLKSKKLSIENLEEQFKIIPTVSMKPEPIPISVKVILIGSSYVYSILYDIDEDFRKLFKIRAQFDYEMERNEETENLYASFIATRCRESGKDVHFSNDGIAEVVEYGSRLAEDKYKLTTQFSNIVDVINESIQWAFKDGRKIVNGEDVKKTISEKKYRSNLIEEKIQKMIKDDLIHIEVSGSKVGQINGLSVSSTGEYEFGRPSRITAVSSMGRGNVINIEKESKLSGPIFDKAVMVISSYLASTYCNNRPFPLSVTLCFEQSYEGIEGDSASAAEFIAILSSIGKIRLRQDLAITGSVDQHGNIQPIGGVNYKIEGFFNICKEKGLTGTQGVVIPAQNIRNLMLNEEVINAVKEGKFHIYAISNINEGLELFTGIKAGELREDGTYPEGTVNRIIDDKLNEYIELSRKFSKESEKKNENS